MLTDKNNSFSFTEKKRLRAYYGKHDIVLNIPPLLKIQLNSYKKFLQYKLRKEERKNIGLMSAFNSIFPIESYTGISEIHFIDYSLGNASFDVYECRVRGATYSIPLKIKVNFLQFHKSSVDKHKFNKEKNQENKGDINKENDSVDNDVIKKKEKIVKQTKEQEIYIGDIPFMTSNGTFIINGTERVVVSQLHRSPGVYF
jgi:DNA-directed RNA polymerase subunit beta